ncbi:hypothetical protein LJB98_00605 [Bacteroidales bacterium OttesenSCG-928-M11]|nr:hypothetical protein [Bacteroidales bacterium OttesenSCG-928-M11]
MKQMLFAFFFLLISSFCIFAQEDKAFSVTGSNANYITIPHFSTPTTLTVEAWIKVPNINGTKTIVSWKNVAGGANGDAWLFRLSNNQLQLGEWIGTSWKSFESSVNIVANEWTHVAITRNGTNATLYINGLLAGSSSSMRNTPQCTTDKLTFGAITTTASESFVGQIDDLRIWDVARSASEIATNYTSRLNGNEPGLVGYWQLDGDVTDKTTNSRNGTVTGSAIYVTRFTKEVPAINSLEFKESTNSTPHIEVNATQKGTINWAVTKDNESLNVAEILGGGTSVLASGFGFYSSPNTTEKLGFSQKLTKDESYKVHAIIVNEEGRMSSVLSSSAFTYQGLSSLPLGYHNTDIGVSGVGSVEYVNEVFTLKGGGLGLGTTNDQFHFLYQEFSGDVEVTAEIITKTGVNTTVGVMIRDALSANSKYVMSAITKDELSSNRRYTTATKTSQYVSETTASVGWLKVIRKNGFVASYYSSDGNDWIELYYPESIEFAKTAFVGVIISSNNDGLASADVRNITIKVPGDDVYLSDRGVYFYKKKYTPEPIPTYNANKSLLPVPIIDDNSEWINLYNKAWQIAFSNIKAPVSGSPFVSNWLDEAFDSNIFQWDMIFMTMFSKYSHHIFPGIQSFDNFYCRQKISGSICRAINEVSGNDWFDESSSNLINPPLFSWAEVEYYQATGDKSRFEYVLPVLEKYFEFVENARLGKSTQHKLYWSNGQASGMDNTPRDTGRSGGHYASDEQGWVDMSCQMVIQCNNIAAICEELGYLEKAKLYKDKAAEIGERINQWMWSEEDGIYYDVNVKGVKTNWKTAACFWPMLAGITSEKQDAELVKHLKNPNEFWRDMVFPSLSASHSEYKSNGGYWRGAAWAPTNYAIIKGLETVGYNSFAREASERYVQGIYEVFLQTGTLWENYAPDRKDGVLNPGVHDYTDAEFCRKDFVGWTGLGPISVLIENILGFRMNGASKTINYYLQRADRHGIRNLRMADITTTIITDDRKLDLNKATVTVESNKPYTLIIHFNGTIEQFEVKEGTNTFHLESEYDNIDEPISQNEIELLSNPVKDKLSFKLNLSKSQNVEVSINNLMGSKILCFTEFMEEGISHKSIDVNHLTPALYLLGVSTLEEQLAVKFIKK